MLPWFLHVILDSFSLFSLSQHSVTWWLVYNVRRRPRRATRSGHDVAGPDFDMYLPKAKACLATKFCSTDVAADCRPREKQAAAGQLAGGGARATTLCPPPAMMYAGSPSQYHASVLHWYLIYNSSAL